MKLVLTCEHANNFIPDEYCHLFEHEQHVLNTHEGFDPGAFDLYQSLKHLADFSKFQVIGRLLIETNRSIGHRSLFSRFSNILPQAEKDYLISEYYLNYRDAVQKEIEKLDAANSEIVHLSIHTFTPVLKDVVRNADIGILFDPAQKSEKDFSQKLKTGLQEQLPELKIRFNYPYLGKADGFTTYLRKSKLSNYSGIEIEVNQKLVTNNMMDEKIKLAFQQIIQNLK